MVAAANLVEVAALVGDTARATMLNALIGGMWWFCNQVRWLWLKTLRRRSQKADLSWERFIRLVDRFFPPIKTLHPLPCHRFNAKTRGRSPVR
jgi:hypothetical protein